MGRIKVKLTLDANVAETARTLGLNVSRLAEAAIIEALKVERSRRWREMNNDAIDQYAQEVEKEGLALSRFRSFRGAPFMSQFDVFRLRDGRLVAGLQNDLLGIDVSRIVAPLRAAGRYAGFPGLTPTVDMEGVVWIVEVQEIAAVPGAKLRENVRSLAQQRDGLNRALDSLIDGVWVRWIAFRSIADVDLTIAKRTGECKGRFLAV